MQGKQLQQYELPRPLLSITQVLRQIKRQEHSLHNCLHSLVADAAFVHEIRSLYPDLPLLANLRCGLWYTPRCDDTCYFKSMDGHNGNWSFSLTRLNMHVANTAAQRGGCFIVDATRRGKTFPDALTKTIPIWATVLNRAVAAVRQQQTTAAVQLVEAAEGAQSAAGEPDGVPALASEHWDTSLHLPLCIATSEAIHIDQRLDSWVQQLLSVGADVQALAAVLRKPLRPLWVSQNSLIWRNQLPAVAELPFTPLFLVSASIPDCRQRRTAGNAGEGGECSSYEYVPGAGDDEESWAAGLTPALLWRHQAELLAAGPHAVYNVAKRFVRRAGLEPTLPASVPHPQSSTGASGLQWVVDSHQPAPAGYAGSLSRAAGMPAGGLFWLEDIGLALGAPAAGQAPQVWASVDAVLNCGLWEHESMVAEPRTAVVTCDEAPPRTAVLHDDLHNMALLGSTANGHTAGQQASVSAKAGRKSSALCIQGPIMRYMWLPVDSRKAAGHALTRTLPAAVRFLTYHLHHGRQVVIHDTDGFATSACVAVAVLCAQTGTDCDSFPQVLSTPGGSPAQYATISKSGIRQQLARVTAVCPMALPSRAMLKQVFNYFNPESKEHHKGTASA